MKRLSALAVIFAFCSVVVGNAQELLIKKETTSMEYHFQSSCCNGRSFTASIYPDSVVWTYSSSRERIVEKDVCVSKRKEYEKLVKKLSQVAFSVDKSKRKHLKGGNGYRYTYYFMVQSECYLYLSNQDSITGDYHAAFDLIQQYLEGHLTEKVQSFKERVKEPQLIDYLDRHGPWRERKKSSQERRKIEECNEPIPDE